VHISPSVLNAGIWVIYALLDPRGKMKKCSNDFDNATNYFPPNVFSTEMWNALFSANAEGREKIFKENGWIVMRGTFTPNV
jgi:hypothetical protein